MEDTSSADGESQAGDASDSTGTRPDLPSRQLRLPPALLEFHRVILRAFLANGRPPQQSELRAPAAEFRLELDAAFERLSEEDLVHLDSDGHIDVAYPFSGRDRGIYVRPSDAPGVWAMCAIDALGIPQMSGLDVVITAADRSSQEPVCVETRGGALSWQPPSAVVLLANNGCGRTSAEYTCPLITFHVSERNATDYLNSQPGATGRVLSQTEAHDLAGDVFAGLLSERPDRKAPRGDNVLGL
jgi:alkylmercury lyase